MVARRPNAQHTNSDHDSEAAPPTLRAMYSARLEFSKAVPCDYKSNICKKKRHQNGEHRQDMQEKKQLYGVYVREYFVSRQGRSVGRGA
jgi:hypothetical protein